MLVAFKFEGDLADEHKIPAYEGTKSLEGLTRSVLIISNYLREGRVRQREFDHKALTFNLLAHEPGSFETLYEIAYGAAVFGGPVGLGVAGNLLTDLLKIIYRRVAGKIEREIPQSVAALENE